jgi:RNA polymerase sigma-70 factor, ECF subfamily
MSSTTAAAQARELFQEHGAAVYRFARAMLRHHHDAEDILQETFVKLLHHLSAGGDTTNLRGWLFTVAAHAARDRQRGRFRWIPWEPAHDSPVAPPMLPDEDGRLGAAREAMQRLGPRDRLLIALRASGLSYREIAAAAGLRPASVGRLLARALDRWANASGESAHIRANGEVERAKSSTDELPNQRVRQNL